MSLATGPDSWNYEEGTTAGWVVQVLHGKYPPSYWYGPRSGWGTTSSSSLDYGVIVFRTNALAVAALRRTFVTWPSRYEPVRLAEVLARD